MVGTLMMSKIRVQNTFMNLPDEREFGHTGIYKSLSMPTPEVNIDEWYIYNLPCFEDRENWKLSQSYSGETDGATLARGGINTAVGTGNPGLSFLLRPASMFSYNQELSDCDASHSNGCIPLDENGNLTSIGSVHHLVGDCKPCAFNKHRTKTCMNGIRCNFCHFDHSEKRKSRGKMVRNH